MSAKLWLLVLCLGAIISFFVAISIGQVEIGFIQTFQTVINCSFGLNGCGDHSITEKIVFELRLPRTIMAFIVGAGLAITGVILQTLTRNPLADPYLFGISSGAALGAVIAMSFGAIAIAIDLGALVGSLVSVLIMLGLANQSSKQVEQLVLAGVAVSFMLSSFTSLVLYYSSPNVIAALIFWMMGSFEHLSWQDLAWPLAVVIISTAIFFIFRRWLDAMLAGDDLAESLGIPTQQVRLGLLLVSALLTAVLVSKVGGIAFVGLMVPHICRLLVGHKMTVLLPTVFLVGGCFMVWVDVLARTLLTDQQLPIGVVTSAFGSLFFILLLKHHQLSNK